MSLNFFKDLIDTLEKVVSGVKAIADLPKEEREKYRQSLGETFQLLDTSLNMVIIRLGDILHKEKPNEFVDEVSRLDNYDEWLRAEREFRLCESLRVALRETEGLRNKMVGRSSVEDWDALLDNMRATVMTEGELAYFITQKFQELANKSRSSSTDFESLQTEVRMFRSQLIAERQNLIQQEIALYDIV